MPTIVTYTDAHPPRNDFPRRVISPTHPSPCCVSAMEDLGLACREERWEYAYRRCRSCGFTVRVFVRYLPDHAMIARLRKAVATVLTRNVRAW